LKTAAPHGWTLLELLAVIGLLALLAGLSGFGFRELLPALNLHGAVQDLILDLQAARWRAMTQNQYYRLNFLPDQEAYALEREAGAGGNRWPGRVEGGVREFSNPRSAYYHPGVELVQVSRNPVFSPRGLVTGATIILQGGDRRKIITISSQGRVKVE
jgi:Tfp pilus assembly protein FimT